MESRRLDYWRRYFQGSNSNIFDVIENAILVAASDCPKEFYNHRDRIAEKLFSCRLARCLGCNHVEPQIPVLEEEGELKEEERDGGGGDGCREKGSCNDGDAGKTQLVGRTQLVSNCSYDEAEALTEEIEQESQTVGEVLRIKEVLAHKEDESDSVLFESLRRLQLMALTVETLTATEIGKAVNGLRKHSSKQIRNLAKTLIDGWRVIVDEWVNTTAALALEATPESMNPSNLDCDELPFPPLDEAALMATQTTPVDLSQFFDGIVDDGNPQNSVEHGKDQELRKKPSSGNGYQPTRKQPAYPSSLYEDKDLMRADVNKQMEQQQIHKQRKPQEATDRTTWLQESQYNRQLKFNNGADPNSGPGRPKVNKAIGITKSQPVSTGLQRKPQINVQDKAKLSDDNSVRAKLEIAKRKLHEGYQQADNAKKQRTIQVMELHDLPKQGSHRPPPMKSGNFNQHWANGRH